MRYMLALRDREGSKFKDVQWFMFLDDDLYIRPHALLAMLNGLKLNATTKAHLQGGAQGSGMAIVSAGTFRGFGFTRKFGMFFDRHKPNLTHICRKHKFALAQPALIHVDTMLSFTSAIHSNALTKLQALWYENSEIVYPLSMGIKTIYVCIIYLHNIAYNIYNPHMY